VLVFSDPSQILLPGPIHLLIALAALFWVVRTGTGRHKNKFAFLMLIAFAWTWLFSTAMPASLLLKRLEGQTPTSSTIATTDCRIYLVLGAGEPGAVTRGSDGSTIEVLPARLTTSGLKRVQKAVQAWKQTGGHLVLAGGLGTGPNPLANSIATAMAEHSRALGVPTEAVTTVGHDSANTYDDLRASTAWIDRNRQAIINIETGGCQESIAIVTSAVHMPRTLATAQKLAAGKLVFEPMPVDFLQLRKPSWRAWFPSHQGPGLWEPLVHEVLGMVYYWWLGRIQDL
jgi:uncharacterized SAM-binding protein YcdF (DUF218 family)